MDKFFVNVSQKISEKDLSDFERFFGSDLTLKKVFFDKFNKTSTYEYVCYHPMLMEFKDSISKWLKENKFPVKFTSITNNIALYCHEKLSEKQISDFKNEFEVEYRGCKLNCGDNGADYEFGSYS